MERSTNGYIIEEFVKEIGLPKTTHDSYESESFIVDDMLVVIENNPDEECIDCFAFVGEIPEPSEKLLEKLLEANFLFRQTGGATIGFNKNTRVVLLFYRIPAINLSSSKFFEHMEHFINISHHWKVRIEEIATETITETPMPYDHSLRV